MMTRQLLQDGYVSDPIPTRHGTAFKIRYRVPAAGGKFRHKQETLYGLAGKKAAKAVLNERLQQVASMNLEAVDLTLRSFVDNYWKPHLDRKQTKPSTLRGYQSVLDNHILPFLGDMILPEIAPINVEELLQVKNKAGFSPRTMRNIIVQLNGIFNLAVDNDLVSRSPIRKRHKPVCRKTEKPAWTSEQVRKILEAVSAEYQCLFICVALTGLRLGELIALQWKYVDLNSKTLHVAHSLWKKQLVAPKTDSSMRTIPLGEVLTSALVLHRENSLFTGPENFVFCKQDGTSLNPDVLRKDVLYPVLDRLNIPRPKGASGFHAFRHSAASLINAETGNLKLTQKFLGHSNVSTTADIYTHVSETMEREAADVLERAIFGSGSRFVRDLAPRTRIQ
ncbi:MAG TPA: site-specific integrase [Acidobacteriota bacterium]|nr:site-specific integrase [Acidobacteriota bacterium]